MSMAGTWMSQEVSKWLVNGLFHLLINGVFLGIITHLPTIDPNFQPDIQVGNLCFHDSFVGSCGRFRKLLNRSDRPD